MLFKLMSRDSVTFDYLVTENLTFKFEKMIKVHTKCNIFQMRYSVVQHEAKLGYLVTENVS